MKLQAKETISGLNMKVSSQESTIQMLKQEIELVNFNYNFFYTKSISDIYCIKELLDKFFIYLKEQFVTCLFFTCLFYSPIPSGSISLQ